MTKEGKDKVWEIVKIISAAIITALVMYALGSDNDYKVRVQRLEIDKASIPYVDEKCRDVKEEAKRDKSEILNRLERMENKQDRILELMIKK